MCKAIEAGAFSSFLILSLCVPLRTEAAEPFNAESPAVSAPVVAEDTQRSEEVPEPATFLLLGTGLIVLGYMLRHHHWTGHP